MKNHTLAFSLTSLVICVAGAAVAACGDDASDTSTPDSGAADAAAEAAPTSFVTGTVEEGRVDDAGAPIPLQGASVCVFTSPDIPCVTSGLDGTFSIAVPPIPTDGGSVDFAMVATAEGHLGYAGLANGATAAAAGLSFYATPGNLPLRSDADATTFATQAGFTYPANGTAFIELRLDEGASATLSPASGKGPVYGDANGIPSPGLTAATSSAVVWFGNVTPGPFSITVTKPGQTCLSAPSEHPGTTVAGNWPGPTANSVGGTTAHDALLGGLTMMCQ